MKIWKLVVILALLLVSCSSPHADSDTQSQRTPQATGTTTEEPEETSAESEDTTAGPSGLRTLVIDISGGKKIEVRVEIADNFFEQARGLMYREELGEDRGMLFIYTEERELSYWMKNTRIPLSIAYIDSEGGIVDILDMKPLDDEPPHYVSSKPVQYALEVNQGFFERKGVQEGDHVELPD